MQSKKFVSIFLVTTLTLTIILSFQPVNANVIFFDDFESNDLTQWTDVHLVNGEVSISTNNPHHGTYNFLSTATAGDDRYAMIVKEVITTTCYIKAENVKVEGYGVNNGKDVKVFGIAKLKNGEALGYAGFIQDGNNNPKWFIRIITSGTTFTSFINTTAPCDPTINHCIEFGLHRHSSNGWARLWIDGELTLEITDLSNNDRSINYVWLGLCLSDAGSHGMTMTADCVNIGNSYHGPEIEFNPPYFFNDDFENIDLSVYDGIKDADSVLSITNTKNYLGEQSLKIVLNDQSNYGYVYKTLLNNHHTLYTSAYFYVENKSLDTIGDYITLMQITKDSTVLTSITIKRDTDNVIKYFLNVCNTTNTIELCNDNDLPIWETWQNVQLKFHQNISNYGSATLFINNTPYITIDNVDTHFYGYPNTVEIGVISSTVSDEIIIYCDTIKISNKFIELTENNYNIIFSYISNEIGVGNNFIVTIKVSRNEKIVNNYSLNITKNDVPFLTNFNDTTFVDTNNVGVYHYNITSLTVNNVAETFIFTPVSAVWTSSPKGDIFNPQPTINDGVLNFEFNTEEWNNVIIIIIILLVSVAVISTINNRERNKYNFIRRRT